MNEVPKEAFSRLGIWGGWVVFWLNENSGMSQFESLSEINKGLDFTFDGKNMRPLKQILIQNFVFWNLHVLFTLMIFTFQFEKVITLKFGSVDQLDRASNQN